ncbi:MAG: MBL fold metallo-hydrolase [Nonlabens sp.]|nr:MBL fold metallo-hydrolase [Nonlabens sp.]
MKITILGTGTSQGIPVIGSDHPVCMSSDPKDKRQRVSALIEIAGKTLVIDCGPDFRNQMLSNNVKKLDALLFTHEHADHTAGLDDLRPFYFRQGYLHCFMTERVLASLKERFGYIFATENRYPGVPDLDITLFEEQSFFIDDIEVIPVLADHGFLPVHGFRIENFAYMTDVKTIALAELDKLRGLDVLIINMLRDEPHKTHLNREEALEIVDVLRPKKTYFTHISHHLGFHAAVEETLPANVHLAYDNLVINL